MNLSLLRPLEQLKIECDKRHFNQFEEVQFRVVKSLEVLLIDMPAKSLIFHDG